MIGGRLLLDMNHRNILLEGPKFFSCTFLGAESMSMIWIPEEDRTLKPYKPLLLLIFEKLFGISGN